MAPSEQEGSVDPLTEMWTADRPPMEVDLADLRAEAARRRRQMLLFMSGEVVLTVGLVAWTVVVLLQGAPALAGNALWLGAAWLTWVVVAGFAMWNRRGMWRATAESTRSYLALLEEQARGRARGAAFVVGLVAVMAAAAILLGYTSAIGFAILGLYGACSAWYHRKARRELREIRRIAAAFRGEDRPL